MTWLLRSALSLGTRIIPWFRWPVAAFTLLTIPGIFIGDDWGAKVVFTAAVAAGVAIFVWLSRLPPGHLWAQNRRAGADR